MQYEPDEAPDSAPVQADPTPPVEELPVYSSLNVPGSPEVVPPVAVPTDVPENRITFALHGDDWAFTPPDKDTQLLIQEALKANNLYAGRLNGKWGDFTLGAIQDIVGRSPYAPPSAELCVAVQEYAGREVTQMLTQEDWEAFYTKLEAGNK